MEHTKAPWFYVDYAGSYTLQSGPYYSDPTILDYDGICDNHVDKETAEANARLASKSPEMLEALKELVKWSAHLPELANPELEKAKSIIEELT